MDRLNNTTKTRKGKHLNYEERLKIETLSKIGMKSERIAKEIVATIATINSMIIMVTMHLLLKN